MTYLNFFCFSSQCNVFGKVIDSKGRQEYAVAVGPFVEVARSPAEVCYKKYYD